MAAPWIFVATFELILLVAFLVAGLVKKEDWIAWPFWRRSRFDWRLCAYVFSVGAFASLAVTGWIALNNTSGFEPLGRMTLVWVYSPRIVDMMIWCAFSIFVLGPRFRHLLVPAFLMLYASYEVVWNGLFSLACRAFLPAELSSLYGMCFIGGIIAVTMLAAIVVRPKLKLNAWVAVFVAVAAVDLLAGMPIVINVCASPVTVVQVNYFWELAYELAWLQMARKTVFPR
jgi:hypothetical protein